MKLIQQINQKQIQSIKINQQLQESLKILKLTNQEILEYINELVKNNPFLDFEKNKKLNTNQIEFNLNQPSHIENYKNILKKKNKEISQSSSTKNNNLIENTIEQKKSLRDHLTQQLNIDINSAEDKLIGKMFINTLDGNGYINEEDLKKIYHKFTGFEFNFNKTKIKKVLKKLQKFDPPGIFARNLSECIKIQLKDKKILNKNYEFLLDNLDLIAKNKISVLSKKSKLQENEILKMLEIIKSVNPKPASDYDLVDEIMIIPDIILQINHGIFKITINKSFIPKINFNKSYYNQIKKRKMLRREKEYIKDCSLKGKRIISALNNRLSTLEKVTKEIINYQKKFFLDEKSPLFPLNLKNISQKTGLHTSTISRATANKFIETPKGVFQLKYFFSTGVECGPNSSIISNQMLKDKVVLLIKNEDKNKRLSDERIVFKLKSSGINIARRTVAKYRTLMKIPTSAQRKNINF